MTPIDPDLFIRQDGLPMVFVMADSHSHERQTTKKQVEEGGGVLVTQPLGDCSIWLLTNSELQLRKKEEMFSVSYVQDCASRNTILPLAPYRLRSRGFFSKYQDHDPTHVLLGLKKWTDLPKIMDAEGERVEGGLLSQEITAPLMDGKKSEVNPVKLRWTTYTKKESREVLDWLVSHSAYCKVRGNTVWRTMEQQVCGGRRTWQSLKGHFKTQLVPRIHSFGLEEGPVFKMLAGLRGEPVEEEAKEKKSPDADPTRKIPHPMTEEEFEDVRRRKEQRKLDREKANLEKRKLDAVYDKNIESKKRRKTANKKQMFESDDEDDIHTRQVSVERDKLDEYKGKIDSAAVSKIATGEGVDTVTTCSFTSSGSGGGAKVTSKVSTNTLKVTSPDTSHKERDVESGDIVTEGLRAPSPGEFFADLQSHGTNEGAKENSLTSTPVLVQNATEDGDLFFNDAQLLSDFDEDWPMAESVADNSELKSNVDLNKANNNDKVATTNNETSTASGATDTSTAVTQAEETVTNGNILITTSMSKVGDNLTRAPINALLSNPANKSSLQTKANLSSAEARTNSNISNVTNGEAKDVSRAEPASNAKNTVSRDKVLEACVMCIMGCEHCAEDTTDTKTTCLLPVTSDLSEHKSLRNKSEKIDQVRTICVSSENMEEDSAANVISKSNDKNTLAIGSDGVSNSNQDCNKEKDIQLESDSNIANFLKISKEPLPESPSIWDDWTSGHMDIAPTMVQHPTLLSAVKQATDNDSNRKVEILEKLTNDSVAVPAAAVCTTKTAASPSPSDKVTRANLSKTTSGSDTSASPRPPGSHSKDCLSPAHNITSFSHHKSSHLSSPSRSSSVPQTGTHSLLSEAGSPWLQKPSTRDVRSAAEQSIAVQQTCSPDLHKSVNLLATSPSLMSSFKRLNTSNSQILSTSASISTTPLSSSNSLFHLNSPTTLLQTSGGPADAEKTPACVAVPQMLPRPPSKPSPSPTPSIAFGTPPKPRSILHTPPNQKHTPNQVTPFLSLRPKGALMSSPSALQSSDPQATQLFSHQSLPVIGSVQDKSGAPPQVGRGRRGHRASFTYLEEKLFVEYFRREGGYSRRGGSQVWKEMVAAGVCPGRSWRCLKNRWETKIAENLASFDIEEKELGVADTSPEPVSSRETVWSQWARFREEEDINMVEFFLKEGGYTRRGGNVVWKVMESTGQWPGRTWPSLKGRWRAHIEPQLEQFGVTEVELVVADRDTAKFKSIIVGDGYTAQEDARIVHYIKKTQSLGRVTGDTLWKEMEEMEVVPGKSWRSMRERFRQTIAKTIKGN